MPFKSDPNGIKLRRFWDKIAQCRSLHTGSRGPKFKPKREALVFQRKAPSTNDLCSRASKSGLKAFSIGEPVSQIVLNLMPFQTDPFLPSTVYALKDRFHFTRPLSRFPPNRRVYRCGITIGGCGTYIGRAGADGAPARPYETTLPFTSFISYGVCVAVYPVLIPSAKL
jgi:hypothetical protein